MAPTSDPPRKKGFDLGSPGTKEYIIVGGTALGLALLYFWWQKRKGGAAPADAPAASASAPATPTGLSTADFLLWIKDHTSSTRTTVKAKCPEGFFFVPSFPKGVIHPEGARPRKGGGFCVPDKDKRTVQPGG